MKSLTAKISLVVAVLAILVLALMPKFIGANIEQATIDNLIALIPPETEGQFEIHRGEFKSSWFSSSSNIEVIYTPISMDEITLSMDFDIDHGPLLLTKNGPSIGLAYATIEPSIRGELFDIATIDASFPFPDITLNLLTRFDQSLSINMNIDELNISEAAGELNFAGLSANVDIAADQSARLSAEMGELSFVENTDQSNVLITGLNLTSSTAQVNDILAESRATLSIPSISSSLPLPFSVSDLRIDYGLQASADDTKLSEIYQTIRVESIESEIPVQSFSWRSEIKQINNELLRDYYRLLSEAQSELNADNNAVSADFTELGEKLYLLAIQNPLEINNHIEANAYGGDHTADLRILWSGLSTLRQIKDLDMTEILAALDIKLNISFDLEAIQRSPLEKAVDLYTQQGYLTVDNGRVIVEANLQNSAFTINGVEFPLNRFF